MSPRALEILTVDFGFPRDIAQEALDEADGDIKLAITELLNAEKSAVVTQGEPADQLDTLYALTDLAAASKAAASDEDMDNVVNRVSERWPLLKRRHSIFAEIPAAWRQRPRADTDDSASSAMATYAEPPAEVSLLSAITDSLRETDSFTCGPVQLWKHPWFHGRLSRSEAQSLLASEPPGTFIVRISSKVDSYAISWSVPPPKAPESFLIEPAPQDAEHLRVAKDTNERRFRTLLDVVHHYRNKLTIPLNRRELAESAPRDALLKQYDSTVEKQRLATASETDLKVRMLNQIKVTKL